MGEDIKKQKNPELKKDSLDPSAIAPRPTPRSDANADKAEQGNAGDKTENAGRR